MCVVVFSAVFSVCEGGEMDTVVVCSAVMTRSLPIRSGKLDLNQTRLFCSREMILRTAHRILSKGSQKDSGRALAVRGADLYVPRGVGDFIRILLRKAFIFFEKAFQYSSNFSRDECVCECA
jgi:hypothetical protein